MLGFYAAKLASFLLLPPLILLWPPLLAWLLRKPRLAARLAVASLVLLALLSVPVVGGFSLQALEIAPALDLNNPPSAEAIVVLGGGRRIGSPEYGGDSVNAFTLERLRYAAWLHRRTGRPILVTGGAPGGGCTPEGILMTQTLGQDFKTPVKWQENRALTTWDNARNSATLLKQDGIKRIYLVSHAWHLRRAVPLFEKEGLEVVPAGTGFSSSDSNDIFDWIPNTRAYTESYLALHEWLGVLWYKARASFQE
jgi:uncharacterized SAM-binding protein YcdF (DUF218 family)